MLLCDLILFYVFLMIVSDLYFVVNFRMISGAYVRLFEWHRNGMDLLDNLSNIRSLASDSLRDK